MVDSVADFFEKGTPKPYPKTSVALSQLRQAVAAETIVFRNHINPTYKRSNSGTSGTKSGNTSRKHYQQAYRLKRENDRLRAELASHTASKADGNFLTPDWIVRLFLSSPIANARGLTKSFRDVVGLDKNTVARPTIDKVRGAWVEYYKAMILKLGAERVRGAIGAAKRIRAEFAPVFFVHVQDEADIQLRSGEDDGLPVPRRSRASKVQQNVVELVTLSGGLDIPTELEALGDKTAATLTTSFERLVRYIAAGVLPAPGGNSKLQASPLAPEVWLFHILVGDGIATNLAAAKRLWACMQERGLGPRCRYFLLVIVCGTHQMGLTAKSAVAGRSAAVARGLLHQDIFGVAVRLFKYLVNDY